MNHKSAAIVLPAMFPDSDLLSHCTVAFLGKDIGEIPASKDQVLGVVHELTLAFGRPNMVRRFEVTGTDWFGVERDVPVMRLNGSWLKHYRKVTDSLLAQSGLGVVASTDWEYQPHVTLNSDYMDTHDDIPHYVDLKAPILWWGEDRG